MRPSTWHKLNAEKRLNRLELQALSERGKMQGEPSSTQGHMTKEQIIAQLFMEYANDKGEAPLHRALEKAYEAGYEKGFAVDMPPPPIFPSPVEPLVIVEEAPSSSQLMSR